MGAQAVIFVYTASVVEQAVSDVLQASQVWRLPISRQTGERIARFLLHLLMWNERVNLTGARNLTQLLGEHLPDSFALSKLCREEEDVADVGAGGGLPGIPFALLRPRCRVVLFEPRAKRVAFLNSAVRQAGTESVTVVRARLEDLGDEGFTVAASRATFSPERWLARAQRIVRPDGRVVVFSTAPVSSNLDQCLVEEVAYTTADGAPRWAGAFSRRPP